MDRLGGRSPAAPIRRSDFDAKRMEVLHEAALAFAEEGFHKTTVRSLAERLGVSKPVLYYYARNKDDLLAQCIQLATDQLFVALKRAKESGLNGRERLSSFFSSYAQIMCGDFGRCVALVEPRALSQVAAKKATQLERSIEIEVRQMITDGQKDGSIGRGDPILATRALFGAFNGLPRWFHKGGGLEAADVAEQYLDLFLFGLAEKSKDVSPKPLRAAAKSLGRRA